MFKRILIANRGEIAVRVIRCCRELGIETVAVYSTADEQSLAVQLATFAVCIGPPKASQSYLNQNAIVETAVKMKCEAIHPGFGFLSENPDFVDTRSLEIELDIGIHRLGRYICNYSNKSSALDRFALFPTSRKRVGQYWH